MKKNLILSFLILSVLVVMIGSVSAAPTSVDMSFNHPTTGDFIDTDLIAVQWNNPSPFTSASLQYKAGSCDGIGWSDPLITTSSSSVIAYDWDVSAVSDGTYCLRFQTGQDTLATSGLFTIDRVAPTADADGPYSCNEGGSVTFDGSGSDDDGSGIASYEWFVDGVSQGVSSNPTHEYHCEDGYNEFDVTLTVTDYAGNSDSDDSIVTIKDSVPVVDFSCTPNPDYEGSPITCISSSTAYDMPMSYSWTTNPNYGTGNEQTFTFTPSDNGTVSVTLTVVDGDGSSVSKTEPISVSDVIPTANAGADQIITEGHSVTVTGTYTDNPADLVSVYEWDFSYDGSNFNVEATTLTATSPVYNENGVYTVAFRVKDEDSYSAIDTLTVTVFDYAISLHSGWNLISIPLVPENDDTSIENVFSQISGNISAVWSYTYENGTNVWKYNEFNGTWMSGDSFVQNIKPGYGYYVKMNKNATLYLNGNKMYGSMHIPPSVTLAMDNWDLIGVYGLGNPTIDIALETLTYGSNPYYDVIMDKDGNPVSTLTSTEGYWISIKKVFAGENTVEYKANYQVT